MPRSAAELIKKPKVNRKIPGIRKTYVGEDRSMNLRCLHPSLKLLSFDSETLG